MYAGYPAFFSLYPAYEKSHRIRQLQYQNGVRPLSVWMSHLIFDGIFVLVIAVAATATIAAQFKAFWFAPGWIFLVMLLYGAATLLLTYMMARISRSQLSAFISAFGVLMLMYIATAIAFMVGSRGWSIRLVPLLTNGFLQLPQSLVEIDQLERTTDAISFSLGLLLPTVNLWKALEVGINVYKVRCRDRELVTYPGSIFAYGGPIFLLLIQVLGFGLLLVWLESNRSFDALSAFARRRRARGLLRASSPSSGEEGSEPATAKEAPRVETAAVAASAEKHDLLRIDHVSKAFGRNTAVDDVSLALREGEILALLGPNGAGKTTVANMVVGELAPDAGAILVRGVDVHRHTRTAQRALGVCPQFDALDLLTARQHLELYGRVRGVPDVAGNAALVMRRLGLAPHADKLASRLSGGNKRKLSLGIALMGNPDVLILDEPSSAMDAAAKRAMWKMLAAVAPGRSVLLTVSPLFHGRAERVPKQKANGAADALDGGGRRAGHARGHPGQAAAGHRHDAGAAAAVQQPVPRDADSAQRARVIGRRDARRGGVGARPLHRRGLRGREPGRAGALRGAQRLGGGGRRPRQLHRWHHPHARGAQGRHRRLRVLHRRADARARLPERGQGQLRRGGGEEGAVVEVVELVAAVLCAISCFLYGAGPVGGAEVALLTIHAWGGCWI